jgi:hypothetical protein
MNVMQVSVGISRSDSVLHALAGALIAPRDIAPPVSWVSTLRIRPSLANTVHQTALNVLLLHFALLVTPDSISTRTNLSVYHVLKIVMSAMLRTSAFIATKASHRLMVIAKLALLTAQVVTHMDALTVMKGTI